MAQVCTFNEAAVADRSPASVLRFAEEPIPECPTDRVLVEMLSAPVNPLDILTLQNKYVVKPENRSSAGGQIPGYDGMARVLVAGSSVHGFQAGDHVILARHGIGTWRTHLLVNPDDLFIVRGDICPEFGALLRMGVTPAYLLLEEAGRNLKPGDWVIQNAATGVIAHFVAQFACLRGFRVISVIRDREEFDAERLSLQSHGAELVIQERQLDDDTIFQDKKIMLGLDGVFGRLAERMGERMAPGSIFCSYGFLSGLGPDAHIKISPTLIWMRKVTFEGFRLSQSLASLSKARQQELVTWFASLGQQGRLRMPRTATVFWQGSVADVEVALRAAIKAASDSSSVGVHKRVIRFGQHKH